VDSRQEKDDQPPAKRPATGTNSPILKPVATRPGSSPVPRVDSPIPSSSVPSSPLTPFSPISSFAFSAFAISSPSVPSTPPTLFFNAPPPGKGPVGPRRLSQQPITPVQTKQYEIAHENTPRGIIQQLREQILERSAQLKTSNIPLAEDLEAIAGKFSMDVDKDPQSGKMISNSENISGLLQFNRYPLLYMQPEGAVAIKTALAGFKSIVSKLPKAKVAPTIASSSEAKPAEEKTVDPELVKEIMRWMKILSEVYVLIQEKNVTVETLLELYAMCQPLTRIVQSNPETLQEFQALQAMFVSRLTSFCVSSKPEQIQAAMETYIEPDNLIALLDKHQKTKSDSSVYYDLSAYPIEIILNAFMKHAPDPDALREDYTKYIGVMDCDIQDMLSALIAAMHKSEYYVTLMMRYSSMLLILANNPKPGKTLFIVLLSRLRELVPNDSVTGDIPPIARDILNALYKSIENYRQAYPTEFTSDPRTWVTFPTAATTNQSTTSSTLMSSSSHSSVSSNNSSQLISSATINPSTANPSSTHTEQSTTPRPS